MRRNSGNAFVALAKKDKAAVDVADLDQFAAEAQKADPDLGTVEDSFEKFTSKNKALAASYSAHAVMLALSVRAEAAAIEKSKALEDGLLAKVNVRFEDMNRTEDGTTLLAGAAKPRRYDVATGFVYVTGLSDVVVPVVISVCGWQGCLAPDDVFWSANNGLGRSFSLDAGTRVKTIGKQDLRQESDSPSFLVGLSWNPVTVLRFSTGFYIFENAQKRDSAYEWNWSPYVGVTVNILNAAELLGKLGLGDDVPPSATQIK